MHIRAHPRFSFKTDDFAETVRKLALTCTVLAALLTNALYAGQQKTQYRLRGLAGSASSSFIILDNCRALQFSLSGFEHASREQPGAPTETTVANASIYLANQCTFVETFISVGGVPVITGNVHTGIRISGQVSGFQVESPNYIQVPVSGSIDVVLTPTDSAIHTRFHHTMGTRFGFERYHGVGFFAPAAASGKLIVGTTDYLAIAAAEAAELFSNVNSTNEGYMQLVK
jgi:hypothetical protein